jgi:sirohydrochlorin ferrochelatase
MVTRPLADGPAGFRTVVQDATVAPGETAVVTSIARDRKGRPMAGLLVTWTWKVGTKTIRMKGLTDAYGRARATLLVTTDTPTSRITVSAHVQAASRNRYSSTTLRRG